MTSKRQLGLVLPAVLFLLVGALLLVTRIDFSLQRDAAVDQRRIDGDRLERIERSAIAHLQALSQQTDCGADPGAISVTGSFDGIDYQLDWSRRWSAPLLEASYSFGDNGQVWNSSRSDVELYGAQQTTQWLLAPYFSEHAGIRQRDDDVSEERPTTATVDNQTGDMVLYRLGLGPLRTEPLQIDGARFIAWGEFGSASHAQALQLLAVDFPWKSDEVNGEEAWDDEEWPDGLNARLEAVDTRVTVSGEQFTVDLGELFRSWRLGTRPNYGWAFDATQPQKISWRAGVKTQDVPFAERQRVEIDFRCACGLRCDGVHQNEVVALASLTDIHGHGGDREKLTRHWLHYAHPDYDQDLEDTYSDLTLDAALFQSGEDLAGLVIEAASDDTDPDRHVYHLLLGAPVNDSGAFPSNRTRLRIAYGEAPASAAIGEQITPLLTPGPAGAVPANDFELLAFAESGNAIIGGLALERRGTELHYWTARYRDGDVDLMSEQVALNNQNGDYIAAPLTTTTKTFAVDISADQTIDAIDSVRGSNALISAVRLVDIPGAAITSDLGGLRFNDGALVKYDWALERAWMINHEDERHNSNNLRGISRYLEPGLGTLDDSQAENRFPTLF